ncbi:unnamed protein product [Lactuca saligna]|uniref:Uncharacterized protein n=1 Tax=Lactuca saligna TaxID=75948 RepID=A0AA35Z3C2_LACSI|nr:unnamed protein product [Lactuca saligna]
MPSETLEEELQVLIFDKSGETQYHESMQNQIDTIKCDDKPQELLVYSKRGRKVVMALALILLYCSKIPNSEIEDATATIEEVAAIEEATAIEEVSAIEEATTIEDATATIEEVADI